MPEAPRALADNATADAGAVGSVVRRHLRAQEELRRRDADLDGDPHALPRTPATPPTSARTVACPNLAAPAPAAEEAVLWQPEQPPPTSTCAPMGQDGRIASSSLAFLPVATAPAPTPSDAQQVQPKQRMPLANSGVDDVAQLERLIRLIMANVNKETNSSMSRAAREARAQLQLVGIGDGSSGWEHVDLGQPLLPAHLSRRLESERAARARPGFFGWLFGAGEGEEEDERKHLILGSLTI